MAFDNTNRDKVLHASDIVDVVGEHVALRPKGREFAAVCCFHDDKSPSMFVSPQKQIFKCFVCGAGGSVFDFVMKYHKMGFAEALRFLADRAGIQLEAPRGGKRPEGPSESERLTAANRHANAFFRQILDHAEHGAEARGYLERRGVSAEMIERFEIGAAPHRWDGLVTTIAARGWAMDDFERAQLVRKRKSGDGRFDMLRHRLIFPICDAVGRCVAFGGRRLDDDDEPKYLNSPETAVFHKSKTLYGLHLAKKSIIDSGRAVMVEGYTDVVACHQHGATNVVAALGTALTEDHARILKRFCDTVVLVMDGDAAGQRAADRAIEVFLTADVDVRLATIPGGRDPDELLSDEGLAAWEAVVEGAEDALAWQLNVLGGKLDGEGGLSAKQHAAEAFVQRVVDAGLMKAKPLRRAMVVSRLAELLGVGGDAVDALIRSTKARVRPRSQAPRSQAPPQAHAPAAPPPASRPSDDASDDGPPPGEPLPGDVVELDFDPGIPEGGFTGGGFSEGHAGAGGGGASEIPGGIGLPAGDEPIGPESVAGAITGHTLAGVRAAERRLIAAFIGEPSLLHTELPDGGELAESLTPGDFATPDHRAVYQLVFDAICDRRALSLAALLADVAAAYAAEPDRAERLAAALVRIDDEATELGLADQARDQQEALVRESAATLARFHDECRYQARRRDATDRLDTQEASRLLETLRGRASAVRIARVDPQPPRRSAARSKSRNEFPRQGDRRRPH